ncbi:MAG: HAD-IIIA family hydrolase [Blautia sp.]|nr:HAD-IIIA family hydrolase [Blautia sp.]
MLSLLFPGAYAEDVFSIDYDGLYRRGYRAVIFDIDNTLVPHGADSTPRVDMLFARIQAAGLKTCLLSNNDEERVLRFCTNIDTSYVCDAEKPKKSGLQKALKLLKVKKEEAVLVGDQVFTDIFCANRCRVDSILVRFIGYYTETRIGPRRELEKLVLKAYALSRKYQSKLGDLVELLEK